MAKSMTLTVVLAALLLTAGTAFTDEPTVTSQSPLLYGAPTVKAAVDTVTLMGPNGMYPYRGDFEGANARPGGEGFLPDGWTSVDETEPLNHWHVDATRNPFHGLAAWCGDATIASCGVSDVAGGYGNNWRDIFEFRKSVGAVPATVRVQARLQYDCEPGYDFVTLQRRTGAAPDFEAASGGQGLSWSGTGTATVDYTFNWTIAELVGGTDIAVAFIFDSDGGWSDGDCSWPTDGAARLDDIIVTVNGAAYVEDFEDGSVGSDWTKVRSTGFGDFARVWQGMGDLDDCASNYSKLLAFVDDGLVVPGTGGSVGGPGHNYGPPGGYVVNFHGGLYGQQHTMSNRVLSPVMQLPSGQSSGVMLSFDVYTDHELTSDVRMDPPFYTWQIRSTAAGDITASPWVGRNFVYYGAPAYSRHINVADDLLVPGATAVQMSFWVGSALYLCDFGCSPTDGTPAPYFDNVSVKAYPQGGPRMVITEQRLANDVFPAAGTVNLANLGANSCRFDMAANISLKSHSRNDPGDSIYIDVTPRSGGTLSLPVLHWQFATRNPLFTDAHRTALAPGQMNGSVTGRVTRSATGTIVANRYNFDLPDTGMLFPGDVLHYYFAATDVVAGDTRTSTAPADLSGYGRPNPLTYPATFTVNCLPSVRDAQGTQPTILLWNDSGSRGNDDEWNTTLQLLCQVGGLDYDVFNTHAASSGVGNGLGGRATVSQITGYADMLYTCGDLGAFTLSNGDYNVDASNDLGLLDAWLGLGSRDLFVAGDDLASSLYAGGTAGRDFLANRLGVAYVDGDVHDNIDGQDQPRVVKVSGNPVFTTANAWTVNGGCPTFNDFDYVTPLDGAVRLAQFTGTDGTSTPYAAAAAILKVNGTSRVISLDHDLSYIIDNAKIGSPRPYRVWVLSNVLDYFQAALNFGDCYAGTPPLPAVPGSFAVTSYPNPFNPSVTLHYSLPKPGPVTMKVFDARGTLVRTLLDGPVETAEGGVVWNGTDQRGGRAPSGLYFVETRAGNEVDVRKVTMLK